MSGASYSPEFLAYWAARGSLERQMRDASERLARIPGTGSGRFGLTPDAVKARPDWRAAHFEYWRAHKALAELNRLNLRRFRLELAQERAERRAALSLR
ncbi:hypothetical protein [Novosphingobium sp.]|uniref:hypothetical protein n=1 Tax=Novosphingobium sp. TaxID=1874826 RepID=UPI002FDD72A3